MKIGIFDPDVVDYAVKLEFGKHPFIRPAIDANIRAIGDYVEAQFNKVLAGVMKEDQARDAIGRFVVKIIRDYITAKGLVDTGRMRDSVDVSA